jgi:DNA-binding NarL/FixJ family response regulator
MTEVARVSGDDGDGGGSVGNSRRIAEDLAVLSGARILVVDDEVQTLNSIVRVLEQCRATVITCTSVEAAKRTLAELEHPLDAAVVDFYVLEELGLEVIRSLRAGPSPCCSLMMTASSSPITGADAIRAGADDFLIKPFGLDAFLDAVKRVVERTRSWRSRIQGTPERPDRATAPPFLASDVANAEALHALLASVNPDHGARIMDHLVETLAAKCGLSPREAEILPFAALGMSNAEIAARIGVRERTVKFHVRNLLRKVKAKRRGDVFRVYLRHLRGLEGVEDPDDDDGEGGDGEGEGGEG